MSKSEAANKRRNLLVACGFTAMFTWGFLAFVQIGRYAVEGTLFARVLDGRPYTNDFVSYYNAAVLGRRCFTEKIDIYNIDIQNESLNRLIAPVVPELPFFLQYPPYFFVLVSPLAFLGMLPAWLVWISTGLFLMFCTYGKLASPSYPQLSKQRLLFALVLSSFPCWLSVQLGQTSLFLFAATASFFCLLEEKRGAFAGAVSGLHMIKLQYYPVIGLVGLIFGRFKFLVGAAGILALLLGLSVFVLGLDNVIHYPQALLKGEAGPGISGVSPHAMQNVRGQLHVLVGGDLPVVRYVSLGALVAGIAFVGWLWGFAREKLCRFELHGFRLLAAVTILIMLVTSPHTHSQDYLLLALPAVMLRPWLDERCAGAGAAHLRFARALLIWWPAASWVMFFLMQLAPLTRVQPFFVWALCLLLPVLVEIVTILRKEPVQAS